MMIFLYLLIAVLAFIAGFLSAKSQKPQVKVLRKKGDFGATEQLRREYENFLNYDGTEQS